MRTLRAALALLLAFAVPVRAETTADPLWYLLATSAPASDARAVSAEGEGLADARGLAALQSDLLLLSDGLEGFRDEAQVKETLARLEPRMSPELKPFFKDRASSLDAIYRTLAVADYTWAQRFPEPPCEPLAARRTLLSSRDGLFQTEKGEASPWLVSLLGPQAEGKSAEQALDQASSQARLTGAGYERLRARVRKLTLALASDKAVGSSRSKLYCARAAAFADLAAAHRVKETALVSAARVVTRKPEESVFVVVWKDRRAAAVLLRTKSGPLLVTDAAVVAETDHPSLFAYSANSKPIELTASVVRRHPALGVVVLAYAEDVPRPALALSGTVPAKDDLVAAVGHTSVSGLWTRTSGLVTKAGEAGFQTDAAVSPEMSGGPVLDEAGEVAGLLVLRPADTEEGRWPVAVPAPVLTRWLDDPSSTFAAVPATEGIEDAGTSAVLTRAGPSSSALTEAGLGAWNIPNLPPPPSTPRGVCVANCGGPSSSGSSYSGGYSSNGSRELGQALGELGAVLILKGIPALFRGIGKLFKGAGKSSSSSSAANRSAPEKVEPPPKPKEPPKLVGLDLKLTPGELLEGETLTAVATLRFTGDLPKKRGISVKFSLDRGTKTYSAVTKEDGSASVPIEVDSLERDLHERPFEELDREVLGAQGKERPSYLSPDRKPKSETDKVKKRTPGAFDALDRENDLISQEESAGDEGETNDGESIVAADWDDGSTDGDLIETGAGAIIPSAPPAAIPPAFALGSEATGETVPLQKLYLLTVSAKAVAGPMGTADDSKKASVMSNRCPPGSMANPEPPDGGQPGQPPMGSIEKLALDNDCRQSEEASEEACSLTGAKVCKDAVLLLIGYDFRTCLKRWEDDGAGTPGILGSPAPPKPNRMSPPRRCVPIAKVKSMLRSPANSYARGLGKEEKPPVARGARIAFRAFIKKLLRGARFIKNELHAIFEKQGGYAALSEIFDEATSGQRVKSRNNGRLKTARLPDGTTISLRAESGPRGKGPPTIQVNGPNGEKVKIRGR